MKQTYMSNRFTKGNVRSSALVCAPRITLIYAWGGFQTQEEEMQPVSVTNIEYGNVWNFRSI
jgi:hypothetical protein